MTVKTNPEP